MVHFFGHVCCNPNSVNAHDPLSTFSAPWSDDLPLPKISQNLSRRENEELLKILVDVFNFLFLKNFWVSLSLWDFFKERKSDKNLAMLIIHLLCTSQHKSDVPFFEGPTKSTQFFPKEKKILNLGRYVLKFLFLKNFCVASFVGFVLKKWVWPKFGNAHHHLSPLHITIQHDLSLFSRSKKDCPKFSQTENF